MDSSSYRKYLFRVLILLTVLLNVVEVSADTWDDIIGTVTTVICGIYRVFYYIAGAIASVIFVIAGIKWIASENDPGTRKAAKDTMVHALVGLIIVLISVSVIEAVTTTIGTCSPQPSAPTPTTTSTSTIP